MICRIFVPEESEGVSEKKRRRVRMDVEDAVMEATGSEDGSAASAAPPSRRRRRSQRNISKVISNFLAMHSPISNRLVIDFAFVS